MLRRSTIATTFIALFAVGAICISATSATAGSVYFGFGHGYYGGHDGAGNNTKKSQQQGNSNQQQSNTAQTSKNKKKSKTK